MSERDKRNVVGWAADLSGRRVDFRFKDGLSWGIEVDMPVGNRERAAIESASKIVLPETISKIKFLTLCPQESLPSRLRNIRSDDTDYQRTYLKVLTTSTVERKTLIHIVNYRGKERPVDIERRNELSLMFSVFFAGSNSVGIKGFNKLVSKSRANTVVVIEGHGDDDPLLVGEQYSTDPRQNRGTQRLGNAVPINAILKKYNDPDLYAALILYTCYTGTKGIKIYDVPVAYPLGEIGDVDKNKPSIKLVSP